MIKNNEKILLLFIGKKQYIVKKNNYLILDFINYKLGTKIVFTNINLFYEKFFFYDKFNLKLKINAIILKHFYFKSFSIKKKRRKNFIKKITSYKKKSLLYINNIF